MFIFICLKCIKWLKILLSYLSFTISYIFVTYFSWYGLTSSCIKTSWIFPNRPSQKSPISPNRFDEVPDQTTRQPVVNGSRLSPAQPSRSSPGTPGGNLRSTSGTPGAVTPGASRSPSVQTSSLTANLSVPPERRRGFQIQGKAKALFSFTAQNPRWWSLDCLSIWK